jgi:hypothetical protein
MESGDREPGDWVTPAGTLQDVLAHVEATIARTKAVVAHSNAAIERTRRIIEDQHRIDDAVR